MTRYPLGYMMDKERFQRDGFLVIDLAFEKDLIETLRRDIKSAVASEIAKTQESVYHYNDSPRIFELWKTSLASAEVARDARVLRTLKDLYGYAPLPFQTISFGRGTQQPTHSDSIHFESDPPRLAACWVVLEDTDEESGGLVVYPGSHHLPPLDFEDLGIVVRPYGEHLDAYREYEEKIQKLADQYGEPVLLTPQLGQVVIFDPHLFHAGGPALDPSRTEFSQVTHYFFEGCDRYYCPMFSRKSLGQFAEKSLADKDILGHQIT